MKKTLVSIIVLILPIFLNAQIVTTGMSADSLVRDVLLGSGVSASNITYTGYVNGVSKFVDSSSTNLGITEGIYLTSGSYLQNDPNGFSGTDGPMGPSSNFQSISSGSPGDFDLDAIVSPATTNDAAVLEFDFIPEADTVLFKYIFGSEEYNDYVNSSFNDVFAFILSGVSTPLAPINIALIPGTSTPISIDNVNNGGPYGGVASGPCTNCAYYRDNVNGSIDCVYDGLTVVLTAIHQVICGETYHIKLAIADVNDEVFDSGVFLEAGSLTSQGTNFGCTPNSIKNVSANTLPFDVFPNPISNDFEIRVNEELSSGAVVKIYDLAGKVIMQKEFSITSGMNSFKLSTAGINKGIYFVELFSGKGKAIRKIVID